MTTDTTTKPAIDERLARASNTSNLSVTPDQRGDGYTLIAAGKTPRVVGCHLIALHGEWDGCAKPRRPLEHDIVAIRKTLPGQMPPFVLSPKRIEQWIEAELDRRHREAASIASAWYEAERRSAFSRLKSIGRVSEGLVDIVGKKVQDPKPKVLAVLAWWLDHRCPVCHGTRYEVVPGSNRQSNRTCRPDPAGCGGTGERVLPYGNDGRIIERAIEDCIGRARQHIGAFRRHLVGQLD